MFVYNDCRTDARVLREAASLVAAGHQVTIMARPTDPVAADGDREERDGFEIIRVPVPHRWRLYWTWLRHPWRTKGWIARWVACRVKRAIRHSGAAWSSSRWPPGGGHRDDRRGPSSALRSSACAARSGASVRAARHARLARPLALGGPRLGRRAAGCGADRGCLSRPRSHAACEARWPAGRRNGGRLVYDSHEIFLEVRLERRAAALGSRLFARAASGAGSAEVGGAGHGQRIARGGPGARATARAGRSSSTTARPAGTRRCPGPTSSARRPGSRPDAPIALYHGGFSVHRGLEELAAAILEPGLERRPRRLPRLRPQRAMLDGMALDPRYGGRLHVLAAVPPDELLRLGGVDADVGVMPIQPSTLNHRLSTPNKLFECLAAGVPVVVSDFPEMRRIVLDDPDGPLGDAVQAGGPGRTSPGRSRRSSSSRRPTARPSGPALPCRGPRALELGDRVGPPARCMRPDASPRAQPGRVRGAS